MLGEKVPNLLRVLTARVMVYEVNPLQLVVWRETYILVEEPYHENPELICPPRL